MSSATSRRCRWRRSSPTCGQRSTPLRPPDRASPRTVVLSPGLGHSSYFEHSYLAAHLGYHLAEMGDLVVRDGRVWLRALSGLEPIDVLLRRVDGPDVDPLESSSVDIGVPGLARIARQGGVGVANAIGSGVVSSLGVLPFVAAASRFLGDELALPALTTRWCGNAGHRDDVLDDPTRFVLHDIEGIGPRGARQQSTVFGSHSSPDDVQAWRHADRDPTPPCGRAGEGGVRDDSGTERVRHRAGNRRAARARGCRARVRHGVTRRAGPGHGRNGSGRESDERIREGRVGARTTCPITAS